MRLACRPKLKVKDRAGLSCILLLRMITLILQLLDANGKGGVVSGMRMLMLPTSPRLGSLGRNIRMKVMSC